MWTTSIATAEQPANAYRRVTDAIRAIGWRLFFITCAALA